MKASTFKLIDAINCEGLDNSHWGIIEDIESTKDWFGTIESDEQLNGQYVYVWVEDSTTLTFMRNVLIYVNHRYRVDGGYILLWKI